MAVSALANIRRFDQLVKYLRDELDWPIQSADFDDLTFDFTPEELGIDSRSAAKIQEIKRLRPLSPNQPWGVFFVKFEPKRLPIVALRRILSSFALKRRASANPADRRAWAAEDLLFISNYGGDGDDRKITFAHFSQSSATDDLPTLRVLGWDNLDTSLHIDHVADTLRDHLRWPRDEHDAQGWREEWRQAFTVRYGEVITTSRVLATRLAELARAIRDRIRSTLAIEIEAGPLTTLMGAFREALVHDLDADGFADMYAQTIAYGLLSARIANPKADSADDLATQMPVTSPFLRELMETFMHTGSRRADGVSGVSLDFDELGVTEVVELLDRANMEAVLRDFGDRNPQEDPVIHFYELFLKEYDPKEKLRRGVFYTPRPVVSYIVRAVDEILRTEFGLPDGLADTATWGEMTERHPSLTVPSGVAATDPFVTVLDPATGTGTFLVEVIETIHRTLVEKWVREQHDERSIINLWNDYVAAHLLPRLYGYELLMAPYAIAHLKIGLKLRETGYRFETDQRARIYLTNALEPASDFSGTLTLAIPALAHEAEAVNAVKAYQRFTVVVGNPPYSNYSANLSPTARRIVDAYRTFGGQPIRERNQLQFERNLQDDFVKFVAIGEMAIQRAGCGVLSYITNATLLTAPSLRGVREHLMNTFARVQEVHLHGGVNERTAETATDENVFDISQAVAVHVYIRPPQATGGSVSFAELIGRRVDKYERLLSQLPNAIEWREIEPDSTNRGFTPHDNAAGMVVRRLPDVFVRFGAGIKTNRDAVAVAFSRSELRQQLSAFAPDRVIDEAEMHEILYRPFDVRWVAYSEGIVASRSLPTMQHMLAGSNLGLVASSSWTTPERFSVNVSERMVEMKSGTHDRGTTLFPLYRYESLLGGAATAISNLTPEFTDQWRRATETKVLAFGRGDLNATTGPEDVFCWLYGLFYAPAYREGLRAALAQGFPAVLLPRDTELMRKIVGFGQQLVDWHLLRDRPSSPATSLIGTSTMQVTRLSYARGTVWLDDAQTYGITGVPPAVWEFRVGGYQVCEKWLKDRKGRVLTAEDLEHYNGVVIAARETMRLMGEIDAAIDEHGGWPTAFQQS